MPLPNRQRVTFELRKASDGQIEEFPFDTAQSPPKEKPCPPIPDGIGLDQQMEVGSRGTGQLSESRFLSPTKPRCDYASLDRSDQVSAVSSNCLSFYLDNVDEMQYEKKSVAEKLLLKSKTSLVPAFEKEV